MSTLDDSFAKLLGRQPSDEEKQHLYKVKDALHLQNDDALWLVLIALEHYQTLYEQIPGLIDKVAVDVLRSFRITAEATAKAANESAKADLSKAVAEVAHKVAKDTAGARLWQWAALSILIAMMSIGAIVFAFSYQFEMGFIAGKDEGFRKAYATAEDEKAAASWANTPDGKLAFKLFQMGSIPKLANCSADGWKIEKGMCYPMEVPKIGVYGWRVALP